MPAAGKVSRAADSPLHHLHWFDGRLTWSTGADSSGYCRRLLAVITAYSLQSVPGLPFSVKGVFDGLATSGEWNMAAFPWTYLYGELAEDFCATKTSVRTTWSCPTWASTRGKVAQMTAPLGALLSDREYRKLRRPEENVSLQSVQRGRKNNGSLSRRRHHSFAADVAETVILESVYSATCEGADRTSPNWKLRHRPSKTEGCPG